MISDGERQAIYTTLKEMDLAGMMTKEFISKSSREAYESMKFQSLTDNELEARIDGELNGISYSPKPPISDAQILARESAEGDRFYKMFIDDFPNLTNEELVDMRLKLTISLVMIRLQMDYNGSDGLPKDFYEMAKVKTVTTRNKITQELIRRGVTRL